MSEASADSLTYFQAMTELRELVERLSNEQDIDQLAREVSRAKILIDFCRSRIASAELEINQILTDESGEEPF